MKHFLKTFQTVVQIHVFMEHAQTMIPGLFAIVQLTSQAHVVKMVSLILNVTSCFKVDFAG